MNALAIPSIVFTVILKETEWNLLKIIDAIKCTVELKKMEEISILPNRELQISKLLPMFSPKFNVLFAKIF
jgi:hypothetical protein